MIRWYCNSKKKNILKSFLKKIWIKWIVSLCDEMVEARHFSDIYTHVVLTDLQQYRQYKECFYSNFRHEWCLYQHCKGIPKLNSAHV